MKRERILQGQIIAILRKHEARADFACWSSSIAYVSAGYVKLGCTRGAGVRLHHRLATRRPKAALCYNGTGLTFSAILALADLLRIAWWYIQPDNLAGHAFAEIFNALLTGEKAVESQQLVGENKFHRREEVEQNSYSCAGKRSMD